MCVHARRGSCRYVSPGSCLWCYDTTIKAYCTHWSNHFKMTQSHRLLFSFFVLTFTVPPQPTVTTGSIRGACKCPLYFYVFLSNMLSRADSSQYRSVAYAVFVIVGFSQWKNEMRTHSHIISNIKVYGYCCHFFSLSLSLYCFLIFCCQVMYGLQWANNILKDSLNYCTHTLGVSGFILHNDDCSERLSCKDRRRLCWCFPIWSLRAMRSEALTSTLSSWSDLDIISLQHVLVFFSSRLPLKFNARFALPGHFVAGSAARWFAFMPRSDTVQLQSSRAAECTLPCSRAS